MSELSDAFSLLKIANSPVLSQFLHDCVDNLTGTKNITFDSYNSDIEWTIDDFNKAKSSIEKFYRETVVQRGEFHLKTKELSPNVIDEIRNCYDIRKDDIYEALVREHLVRNGHKLVQNFDWKLRWILGSSKLASLKKSIVQLDLNCMVQDSESDCKKVEQVHFEMDLEKLNVLIDQLEKIQSEIKSH